MSSVRRDGRRQLGAALLFCGVLLIFLCLPMRAFVIALGAALAALGLLLIR